MPSASAFSFCWLMGPLVRSFTKARMAPMMTATAVSTSVMFVKDDSSFFIVS